jgi:hypothetical protein
MENSLSGSRKLRYIMHKYKFNLNIIHNFHDYQYEILSKSFQ